jgi:hypothetical protein
VSNLASVRCKVYSASTDVPVPIRIFLFKLHLVSSLNVNLKKYCQHAYYSLRFFKSKYLNSIFQAGDKWHFVHESKSSIVPTASKYDFWKGCWNVMVSVSLSSIYLNIPPLSHCIEIWLNSIKLRPGSMRPLSRSKE